MGDRRGDDVASPGVLDGHRDPPRHAEIPGLSGLGESAELPDLDVHHVHGVVPKRPDQAVEILDRFVHHEGVARPASDRAALLVGPARLFDVDVPIRDGPDHPGRFVRQPAGVRIGDQDVPRLDDVGAGVDPGDVRFDVAADLQLEAAVPLLPVSPEVGGHLRRVTLRDRPIEHEIVPVAAAEQGDEGEPRGFAEQVPAGHVDGALHVGMTLEAVVHRPTDHIGLPGIEADQRRRHLGDAGSGTGRVGREIDGTERGHFADAHQSGVGLDADDRRIEDVDRLAARPAVPTFVKWEVDLVDEDASDLHGSGLPRLRGRVCCFEGRVRCVNRDRGDSLPSHSTASPRTGRDLVPQASESDS